MFGQLLSYIKQLFSGILKIVLLKQQQKLLI